MYQNRLRIIILNRNFQRNSKESIAQFTPKLEGVGARYGGYMTHGYGMICTRAHFFIIDEPTDQQIADVMSLQQVCEDTEDKIRVEREFRDATGPVEYNLETILADVAKVVLAPAAQSLERALCWSGVQVLARMARQHS